MPHFVYILRSLKDGKYYVGETADVNARLQNHNAGLQRSTKGRRPFELVLTETYPDRITTLKRERESKSWKGGPKFKQLLRRQ